MSIDPFGDLLAAITEQVDSWLGPSPHRCRQVERHPLTPNLATLTWWAEPPEDTVPPSWKLTVAAATSRDGHVSLSWQLTAEQHNLGHHLDPAGDVADLLSDLRAAIAPAGGGT